MKIYLDFQGTICEIDENPSNYRGRMNFGCMEIIHKLQLAGHQIILNTSYAEDPEKLEKILDYINLHPRYDILPITEVAKEKLTPPSWDWDNIKMYNEMYIDDYAYGIPLKKCCMSNYNMVDWDALDLQFKENNIYDIRQL